MMSLSAVIVDDEQLARDELAFLLKAVGEVDVVAQGRNGVEAVNLIKEHNPDLVFLDVQMPGLDGFGVIKKLLDKKVRMPQVVFSTAFDQYAVKAFEVNAVDYLLKPFDKKRVAESIQRARRKLESTSGSGDRLDVLVRMLEQKEQQQSQPQKILIKSVGRLFLVDQKEICHASIEDGVITVSTSQIEGQSNCRTLEELSGAARQQTILARTPFLPGEHQSDTRSCAVVQELLHAPHGRQEADRNSGEPRPDQAAAGVVQAVAALRPS